MEISPKKKVKIEQKTLISCYKLFLIILLNLAKMYIAEKQIK